VVILLASVAAVMFAATSVTAKRGMQNTNVLTALIVSLMVTTGIIGVAVLFDPPDRLPLAGIALLAAAGLAGDGVGRLSMLTAVDRLGPSVAIPIQTAAYPLIALVGGIVLLSERVTILHFLGAVAVVAGVWVLLGPNSKDGDPGPSSPGRSRPKRSALLLPVLAGIGFAVSDIFRKSGLNEIPHPAFGAFVAVTTILVLWLTAAVVNPRFRRQLRLGPGWGWLIVSGICVAVSLLALFSALETGAVSVVGPIVAAQPLAVVFLSWIVLRQIERVDARMVAGAVLVVAGVVLIAVAV
jgi:transporter family protein